LFVVIYFAVEKAVNNNMISGIVGGALSLLITISFLKKGFLTIYFGQGVGTWMIMLGIIIFIILLFVALSHYVNPFWALVIIVFSVCGLFIIIDIETVIPESIMSESLQWVIWFMRDLSTSMGYILFIIAIVIFIWKKKKYIGQAGLGIAKAPFKGVGWAWNKKKQIQEWRWKKAGGKLNKAKLKEMKGAEKRRTQEATIAEQRRMQEEKKRIDKANYLALQEDKRRTAAAQKRTMEDLRKKGLLKDWRPF
jgi:hypothetical protein